MLEVDKRVLGAEHTLTLQAMWQLIPLYYNIHHMQELLELGEEVIQIHKRVLGVQHVETLDCMGLTACQSGKMGLVQSAANLFGEALRFGLGAGDEHTVNNMCNLAEAYGQLGQSNEEAKLWKEIIDIRE